MAKVVQLKRGRGRPLSTAHYPSLHIKLPPPIYEAVKAAAAKGDRSINAEVARRLIRSFPKGVQEEEE